MCETRPTTAFSVIVSRRAIEALLGALGHERQDLVLASRGSPQGVVVASGAGEHQRDDLGVQHGATGVDPVEVGAERGDVSDALEQVPDSRRPLGEQLDCVAALYVLREHDDRGARPSAVDLQRRYKAFVGMRWGHANVSDHQVGRTR